MYPLQKPDYAREVTDTSHRSFVLVNLASSQGSGNVESRILSELWRQLAARFGDIKFCEIRADLCVEGYPEKNTPTILVYRDGEIRRQFVTLRELGGVRTKVEGACYYAFPSVVRVIADGGRYRASAARPGSAERE